MKKMPSNKHRFSVILMLAVITVCMLLAAGCKNSDKSTEPAEVSVLEEIQERGVLKVGATGDYNPVSYLDPETGEYVGFDTELAEDLADDLAISGITITDARKEQAMMSDRMGALLHRSSLNRLHMESLGC